MKKIITLFFTILFSGILMFGCSKKEETKMAEEAVEEKQTILQDTEEEPAEEQESDEPENILLSTETETGMTWRARIIAPLENQTELSQNLLLSTIWVSEEVDGTLPLFVFFKDNIVLVGFIESGQHMKGRYEIKDNRLIIKVLEVQEEFRQYVPVEETMEFVYEPEYSDFKNKTRLKSTSDLFHLFPAGLESKSGEVYDYEGIKTIKLDECPYLVLNYSKIRVAPKVESDFLENIYGEPFRSDFRVDHVLPGDTVNVVGKTTEEETINDVTAYWYLCRHGMLYGIVQTGWVFGGDLGEFDPEKVDDYQQQFDLEVQKCRTPEGGV